MSTEAQLEETIRNLPTGYNDMMVLYSEILNLEDGFIKLLDSYDEFRVTMDSIRACTPEEELLPDSIYVQNGRFNDDIFSVENLWNKKVYQYNEMGGVMHPDSLMAGNTAMNIELPAGINIQAEESKTDEEKVQKILESLNQ
ncbi:MAG: hypothetical protein ACNFW9_03405 [Candidatus Kerfeldbacteria bacterium]